MVARVVGAARRQQWATFGVAAAGIAVLYLLAVDQGLLLSAIQGSAAFDQNFIHELVHDARHAAGFPCH
jgi:cobalt transporter subunit CbtB